MRCQILVAFFMARPFGELRAVVRLYTFDRQRECLDEMLEENGEGIGAVLIKSLYITPAGVLVDCGALIELLPGSLIDQAGGRDELDIDLDQLSRMAHLLIRLGDILGIQRLDGQSPPDASGRGRG